MIDFNEILANTLGKINQGFDQAISDFIETVDSVDSAVKGAHKEGLFGIGYSTVNESPKGSVFRVYFDPNADDLEVPTLAIGYFLVPYKGYPIQFGQYRKLTDDFKPRMEFPDRAELEKYFANELSDPESSIIQAIGFGLRSTKKMAEEDEELPF